MTSILLLLLAVLMFMRVPLFIVFAAATLVYIVSFTSIPPEIVIQRAFSGLDKFPLIAVPLFIFAASIMTRGGMSERIVSFAKSLVSPLPGGLAITTIVACMLFGAVSGSSPATVIAIGGILLPGMIKEGYSRQFSTGLITSSASVAAIIPPSIGMIIYGTVVGASVGALFIAGILPGLVFGLLYIAYVYLYCTFSKSTGVRGKTSVANIGAQFRQAIWALGVPIIIIGGIYGGVMTPTESAAVASAYAVFVAMFIYREMDFRQLMQVSIEAATITAQIMILIAAASALSWLLTIQHIPVEMSKWLTAAATSEIGILLTINAVLILAGMFLDPTSVTVIFAPLFLPLATSIGVDPIHLGIIMIVNGALGMFTPPFGFNLFVATSLSKLSFVEVSKSVVPFIFLSVLVVLLVTFVPSLSLWLPAKLGM